MNFLNALSCALWGIYHWNSGRLGLALSNFAGDICTLFLIPGCLYAGLMLGRGSLLVVLSEIFVNLFYRLPMKLCGGTTYTDDCAVTSSTSAGDVVGTKGKKSMSRNEGKASNFVKVSTDSKKTV